MIPTRIYTSMSIKNKYFSLVSEDTSLPSIQVIDQCIYDRYFERTPTNAPQRDGVVYICLNNDHPEEVGELMSSFLDVDVIANAQNLSLDDVFAAWKDEFGRWTIKIDEICLINNYQLKTL